MPRASINVFRCAVAAFLATLGATPARADFYTLDGKFSCLDSDGVGCTDRGHAADQLVPKNSTGPAPREAAVRPSGGDPLIQAPPALSRHAQNKNVTPYDSLRDIAGRIETGNPTSEDLQHLRALSRTGDGHAIELLAWCDYFGVGLPRDPVAAYILYGIASLAGIAGASANQAVIYNYVLTPNQRQMVLDIQNDDFNF